MAAKAYVETIVEASPTEVSKAIIAIMPIPSVDIHFKGETIEEKPLKIVIKGKRGMTWWSLGQKLKILITEDGHGGSNVHAESESWYPLAIIDRENRINLEHIFTELTKKYEYNSPLRIID